MGFFNIVSRTLRLFSKKNPTEESEEAEFSLAPEIADPARHEKSLGILVFEHTGEVIQAERLLRQSGFTIEIKGPPPNLRTGCDMIIVFDLLKELAVRETLRRENMNPMQIVPLTDSLLEPVALFQSVDLGDWFMIRAANMKITVHKCSGKIVNISGGGCPDVPYLASLLTGTCITEAEEPRIQGQTLCAYSLQKAFEEARRIWVCNKHSGESL